MAGKRCGHPTSCGSFSELEKAFQVDASLPHGILHVWELSRHDTDASDCIPITLPKKGFPSDND